MVRYIHKNDTIFKRLVYMYRILTLNELILE